MFEGYRRVQIVSQSLALLNQRYPTLLLVEDFVRFAELVMELPSGVSMYQNDIKQLQTRASNYILEQQSHLPPFSSFFQIEHTRKNLTIVLRHLRHDIYSMVKKLYEDSETKKVMNYITQGAPKHRTTGYYTGVLTKMTSLSEFATTQRKKIPKSVSREKMQWILLDSSKSTSRPRSQGSR